MVLLKRYAVIVDETHELNLHSNMVLLKPFIQVSQYFNFILFTFQYGAT